jgi:hypothetical protein
MKSRIKTLGYISLSVCIFILISSIFVIARPHRPALLPDQGGNFGCGTCHVSPLGGGPRNAFGQDWEAIAIPAGDRYVDAIANIDSDGDGFINDQEFSAGTHPGDPNSHPVVSLTITATAADNGSISPSGQVAVNAGENQTFTITPDTGYHIQNLLVDGAPVDINSSYTFTNVTDNHTISATFAINTLTVTATANEHGSINPSGEVVFEYGTTQEFVITPDEGYHIAEVLVNGNQVPVNEQEDSIEITAQPVLESGFSTINVEFAINTYTINATAGDNGSISPEGAVTVEHVADQEFTIIPDEGYKIEAILIDGESVGAESTYTFTDVTSNHTIDAIFVVLGAPDISVSPVSHDFQNVEMGSSSELLAITISNIGNADLNISDIVLSNTTDYTLDVNSCESTTPKIAAGAECNVGVIFNPSSIGSKSTTLTISSDDPDTPGFEVELSGFGTGIKGDVNGDGQVRSNDAILTLRISARLIEPSEDQRWAADINDDGAVRSNDAILILRKSAGLAAPGFIAARERGDIAIEFGEIKHLTDRTISVSLMLRGFDELAGGDICIAYDNHALRAINVTSNTDILLASNISQAGLAKIAFATNKLSDENLAQIEFDVIADGDSLLSFREVSLYTLNSLPVDSRFVDKRFNLRGIVPDRNELLQNFPNPFNPETWIPYNLKKAGDVKIRIYSTSGELVRELDLGHKSRGIYISQSRAAYWDGKNKHGIPVASGTYFYSIQTDDFSAVRKLTVLK